jgi:hypothetical protein
MMIDKMADHNMTHSTDEHQAKTTNDIAFSAAIFDSPNLLPLAS